MQSSDIPFNGFKKWKIRNGDELLPFERFMCWTVHIAFKYDCILLQFLLQVIHNIFWMKSVVTADQ